MTDRIKFSDYLHEAGLQIRKIPYRALIPHLQQDESDNAAPNGSIRLRLRPLDVFRLLSPYVNKRFSEQFRAIAPLTVYLVLFQWLVLHSPVSNGLVISIGLLAALVGLMFFLEGLKLGLMPFGELIGNSLPRTSRMHTVLILTFILGVGVTFAEPSIGVLQVAGSIIVSEQSPVLHTLLNSWSLYLVIAIGVGVGIAAVIGTLRFIFNWSMKPIIYVTLIPALGLTIYARTHPELQSVIGLAWDCGAVTTGPVTVPLVIALGIGVASAVSRHSSSLSGFGIVTLASIIPVTCVLGLGIFASAVLSPGDMANMLAKETIGTQTGIELCAGSPCKEVLGGFRAIVPLIIFLFFVLKVFIRGKFSDPVIIAYGLVLCLLGMIVFNLGLSYGLAQLGGQAGRLIPGAFTSIDSIHASPLFSYGVGVGIAFLFAWLLGFGATMAEPALNALGITVENLTSGAFRRNLLIYAVAIGVAAGIGIGVLQIIFQIDLTLLLLVLYGVALALTVISSEAYVAIAWDCAGVTTGPVTVPLVLVMGLGISGAVNAPGGFGILALASACPIISVMVFGLIVEWRIRWMNKGESSANEAAEEGSAA